MYMLDL